MPIKPAFFVTCAVVPGFRWAWEGVLVVPALFCRISCQFPWPIPIPERGLGAAVSNRCGYALEGEESNDSECVSCPHFEIIKKREVILWLWTKSQIRIKNYKVVNEQLENITCGWGTVTKDYKERKGKRGSKMNGRARREANGTDYTQRNSMYRSKGKRLQSSLGGRRGAEA